MSEIVKFAEFLQEKKIVLELSKTLHLKKIATVEWDYDRSAYEFYYIINFISSIIDEAEFSFKNKKMTLSTMDASRIMLLNMEVKGVKISKPFKITLNLNDFAELLKSKANDKRKLKLIFHNDTSDSDGVEIHKIKGKSTLKKYLLKLDIETEDAPISNLMKIEYPSKFKVPKYILNEILSQADIYSEILVFTVDEDKIVFSSVGQIGELKYIIPLEDLPYERIEGSNIGSYSLSFLRTIKNLFPILKKNYTITYFLRTDYPLKMQFNIDKLNLKFVWFLAPRV
jgi:hypothetical protein